MTIQANKHKKHTYDKFSQYYLRHTFDTVSQQYIRPDIVDLWMGDSLERLIGKVYTHFPDEFMREQMNAVFFTVQRAILFPDLYPKGDKNAILYSFFIQNRNKKSRTPSFYSVFRINKFSE